LAASQYGDIDVPVDRLDENNDEDEELARAIEMSMKSDISQVFILKSVE